MIAVDDRVDHQWPFLRGIKGIGPRKVRHRSVQICPKPRLLLPTPRIRRGKRWGQISTATLRILPRIKTPTLNQAIRRIQFVAFHRGTLDIKSAN